VENVLEWDDARGFISECSARTGTDIRVVDRSSTYTHELLTFPCHGGIETAWERYILSMPDQAWGANLILIVTATV